MEITDLQRCPPDYWELDKKFNTAFGGGTHINYFLDCLVGMGIFSFDVMKFDVWFKRQFGDYEGKGISLKEAIREKFGGNVVKIIERLIGKEDK